MPGLGRLWHTMRHLRPVQLYGRVWFRLTTPRADLRPAPVVRRAAAGAWHRPVEHRMGQVSEDVFCFLNQTHALSERGWDDPGIDKLWRFNLHYFDDLTAPSSPERLEWQRALLGRWVTENPPARGSGWEPYPTSLRIVNWIKWALAGNELPDECVQSLAVQARWLSRRLESHLLGNHLFVNAKALFFAGLFFEGAEADRWRDVALRILAREIPEQILEDGGQFELSPMYHALALEDMLDLVNLATAHSSALPANGAATIAYWRERIESMRRWLRIMSHPDGEISFFNDAAVGIAPAPAALESYAERLALGAGGAAADAVSDLEASGYVRVACGHAVALLDTARVGPDYLPAHAHADTLSFELALYGQRVLVNSGTSLYGGGEERLRQRGTAAHNTVVINCENSTEVWGGFRVARRAMPIARSVTRDEGAVVVRCAHDGYGRLSGRPRHLRRWTFSDDAMTVEDRITGGFETAEARFHLHPSVRVASMDGSDCTRIVILHLAGGQRVSFDVEAGTLRTEETTWHPEFGRSVPALCLVVRLAGALSRIHMKWNTAA